MARFDVKIRQRLQEVHTYDFYLGVEAESEDAARAVVAQFLDETEGSDIYEDTLNDVVADGYYNITGFFSDDEPEVLDTVEDWHIEAVLPVEVTQ